jgi:hypothetical protein
VVDALPDGDRDRLLTVSERIMHMADEAGQTALYGVTVDPDARSTGCKTARATWMFLEDAQRFQYAEDVKYTDERRRGRMWDGFAGIAGLPLSDAAGPLEALKRALREHFRSTNVHIDVFQRHRPTFDEGHCLLTQVTIYLEERADDILEFHNGDLVRHPRRPVSEASLTYEATTGTIEVVARARDNRQQLARLLAQHLLAADVPRVRITLRRFDLSVLLRPFDFPTDPEDAIERVRVNRLRLMPIGSEGERITLECLRGSTCSLPEMAQHRFGAHDPLLCGWLITQAKLTIRFFARGNGGGRTLPLTITRRTAAT